MTPLPSAAPLPPGCPWSGWAPPNVQWCEENLCALVTAPANTWSNLAYIVVGLVMWAAARRLGRSDLRFYGPAAIVVGVFSLAYHASYTFFFQFFDFVGMFVFLDLVILVDLGRLGRLQPKSQLRSWWLMVAASSALVPPLFFAGIPIQLLVAATIAVWVPLEFVLWRARGGSGRLLWLALALSATAGLFSGADVTRVYCNPHDHFFQGHAIWHVLTAASFYALFRHHQQLPPAGSGLGKTFPTREG
ncbi:MAG: ceramidase domain-containing protein [Myxococcota bacterium]